ncbi:hypothetical protein FE257_000030 [Aspergillus nanangensis]|uniref:Tyrosinase copper-binding domain-containing protein n=1 Tax=Aspergillus nanangensis TaxID=2582783 RepID=A0AAD4D0D9_ASPNN|nr:hypothetical protein FE257_000030 [Aspergillus nanangensis]
MGAQINDEAFEGFSVAAPSTRPPKCSNPPKRKEWRQLSKPQRLAYLDAVKCLTTTKSITSFNNTLNRFDDFQAVHNSQTDQIHFVGFFILWHRYFVATYEKALREECGYRGAQPYWNVSQDATLTDINTLRSFDTEIFDPRYGFGGNGEYAEHTPANNPLNISGGTGGGCVQDGPFREGHFVTNFPTRSCLKRDFIPWIFNTFGQQSVVDSVQSQPDYATWALAIEGIPSFDVPNIHASGHFGVGGVLGQAGNAYNSPGEPLFYLHHGNLDRIFWEWQQQDLATRLRQVGGPVAPFDYGGVNVTLDFEVDIGELSGRVPLSQLMDIKGGFLCYEY